MRLAKVCCTGSLVAAVIAIKVAIAVALMAGTFSSSVAQAAQPVLFYAWGGSPAVNDYLRWAERELRAQGVALRHVKVADIAEVVTQLRSGRSNADLVWINGENFHALKAANKLSPIFDSNSPNIPEDASNIANINPALNWQNDFGEPVAGLEVPWGVGQFHLLLCADCELAAVDGTSAASPASISAAELLAYAKAHPGRLTYPKPPEFHGTTFLKALLLSLANQQGMPAAVFQQPVSEQADVQTAPLWAYLEQLHPLLWQQGENFPSSASEQLNWFANGALDMAVSFNPNDVQSLAAQQRIPAGVGRATLGDGAITNHHYLAIPASSTQQAAARRVIQFLLSNEAQAKKAELSGWGDPAVVRLPNSDMPDLLPVAPEFHASWQSYLEQQWRARFQGGS